MAACAHTLQDFNGGVNLLKRFVFESLEPLRQAHASFLSLDDFIAVLGPMWRKESLTVARVFPPPLAKKVLSAMRQRILSDVVCGVQPLLERQVAENAEDSREYVGGEMGESRVGEKGARSFWTVGDATREDGKMRSRPKRR